MNELNRSVSPFLSTLESNIGTTKDFSSEPKQGSENGGLCVVTVKRYLLYSCPSLPPSLRTLMSSDIMRQGCPHLNHMWVNEVLSEQCYRLETKALGT